MGGHGLVGHLLPGVILAWWLLVPHITTVPCTHRHTHTHLHNRHAYFAISLVPCSAAFPLGLIELEMHEHCSGLQLVTNIVAQSCCVIFYWPSMLVTCIPSAPHGALLCVMCHYLHVTQLPVQCNRTGYSTRVMCN